MSLHEHFHKACSQLKSCCPSFIREWFEPESPHEIRRLQFFWLICVIIAGLVIVCGVFLALSYKNSSTVTESSQTLPPKIIETSSDKIDFNEGWRHKMEGELKKLVEKLDAVERVFQEGVKDRDAEKQAIFQELEERFSGLENQINERQHSSSPPHIFPSSPQQGDGKDDQSGGAIQKFSLNLSDNKNKHLKTVDTVIPAGAFAKTILLSGLDASASMNASSDPRPMLLKLIDHGTLPRRFQSDLKDCHCTAGAFGDLSSERVYARLEKLTCIDRATGEIIETQVAGYIAGGDGKAGIRGIVASKDGQFLARSLMGGIFAGLSNVANPQNRQAHVNPFAPGGSHISPPGIGEMFTSGMASGATTALDRLSQYYIDRAEQLQPVIQVAAGQVVDIVFTEGTFIGSQLIKSEIEKTREDSRSTSQKEK